VSDAGHDQRNSRKFKQIEDLSEKLSAKGSIPRFVDRGEDSKAVAKLIEGFRETILYYQVGYHYYPQSFVVDGGARSLNSKLSTVKLLISQ
jgi:hypothetical protein